MEQNCLTVRVSAQANTFKYFLESTYMNGMEKEAYITLKYTAGMLME